VKKSIEFERIGRRGIRLKAGGLPGIALVNNQNKKERKEKKKPSSSKQSSGVINQVWNRGTRTSRGRSGAKRKMACWEEGGRGGGRGSGGKESLMQEVRGVLRRKSRSARTSL